MTDFTILEDPIFLLLAISNFFTMIGYNIPYTYLVVRRNICCYNEVFLIRKTLAVVCQMDDENFLIIFFNNLIPSAGFGNWQ